MSDDWPKPFVPTPLRPKRVFFLVYQDGRDKDLVPDEPIAMFLGQIEAIDYVREKKRFAKRYHQPPPRPFRIIRAEVTLGEQTDRHWTYDDDQTCFVRDDGYRMG